jgi:serine/threonine protein kinase
MPDQRSGRHPDDATQGPAPAPSDSQLRLVTEDGAVVFPEQADPTDESPTIISKGIPAHASPSTAVKAATTESLFGSLRGRTLAHFELIAPIGVGGMAAVLRARDTQLDRSVALKILPPDMANDPENVRRFLHEARAAAKLDHENIARVFFCGEDQKLHFIAFEFVEGDNLRSILQRRGQLPVAEAVRYILQIATGLEHAASRGVVHRDVKPSNIIITPTGRAKLVDMGLARSMEPQTDQLTHSGVTLGTYDYISPEQALEPREADARSDIYSLGCTFYHMLTGHPPVPEGTAAKKLHHHQHVAPADPRQLNPRIPDDIALILGKMMAKNPKDRYQRPVHLVQHLMQVAHKVGAADDLPEGVMFVDTPLLTPPRKRPLLLVSVGALALAMVLMVLSLAPPNKSASSGRPQTSRDDKVAKDAVNPGTKPVVSPQPVNKNLEIASEQDLLRLLADTTSPTLKGIVVKSFDVAEPGLLFQGRDGKDGKRMLILEGKEDDEEPSNLPAITWKYQAKEGDDLTALFHIDGGEATFKNLRFNVEAKLETNKSADTLPTEMEIKTPKNPAAAVAIRGPGAVRFVRCAFVQNDVPAPPYINVRRLGVPLASVLIHGGAAKSDKPQVDFLQCVFQSGQVAVGIHSPADIAASQCAFKPHGAMFHLRGEGESRITLHHCSAFAVTGPVFRLDDHASCQLKIDYSIFSCPDSTISDRDPPHLIHQTDAPAPRVTFLPWKRNLYHNLNAMWSWPTQNGAHIIASLDDFQREILPLGGRDPQSTWLPDSVNIWYDVAAHTIKSPKRAFRLNPELREVRDLDLKTPLGIEKSIYGDIALEPFKEDPKVADLNLREHEKVVDPTTNGKTPGVYETIGQALGAAKSGDVILLKHGKNRELDVEMTLLKKNNVDLTLRPYDANYQPILTLGQTLEPNAYFFRLHDGKMTFENLEIVLEPDQQGFRTQTLTLLDGNAACFFRNCVITLKQNVTHNPLKAIPLSIVTLSDIDEAMMVMGSRPTRPAAEVAFENCFIRGEGETINNRAGRPLELRLENTLVGLTGALVVLQGASKEAAPESQVRLNLLKSSIFTTEPLLVARQGKHIKGLPPVRVERAKDCLFVALDDRPLIVTDYAELSELTLRMFFDWRGASNAYSGFDRLLEDVGSGIRLDPPQWKDMFYKESEPRFVRTTFEVPSSPRQLWLTTLDAFRAKAEAQSGLQPYGATLDAESLPPLESKVKSE